MTARGFYRNLKDDLAPADQSSPGPWLVIDTAGGLAVVLEEDTRRTICNIAWKAVQSRPKRTRANARLIAAAPRMLALIKELATVATTGPSEVVTEARAILHDVEGESNG